MPQQINLFMPPPAATTQDVTTWELPDLTGISRLGFDTETDGLDVWGGNRPVGLCLATEDGRSWYIPWGHDSGFNYDLDVVRRWARENLRDKHLDGFYTKFDVHMLNSVGIDVEALGCKLHDVRHHAIIYDDRMREYDLSNCASTYLGKHKVELSNKDRMREMSSESVRWYARYDALLTTELRMHLQPLLERDDLTRIAALEDRLIYSTCAMERNGAPIDVNKLERWEKEARTRYQQIILKIHALVGFKVIPSKPTDLARLYRHLKLDYDMTDGKKPIPSITNESLKAASGLEPVRLAREARNLNSVSTKYLTKYLKAVGNDGKLRYNINQMLMHSSRYSMSDQNLQQVFTENNQKRAIGDMFIIRELFHEPDPELVFCDADASQIEFRIMAHFAGDQRLIRAYSDDRDVDFHQVTAVMIGETRDIAKNTNFGRSYGMGKEKNRVERAKNGINGRDADRGYDAWSREFPKGPALLDKAARLAEKRGYIKTPWGRRRRYFKTDTNHYTTAWNYVGQGTAGDIMKETTADVYDHRKDLGDIIMRYTVHDSLVSGIRPEFIPQLQELLDVQRIPLKVPIRWKVKTGRNWRL